MNAPTTPQEGQSVPSQPVMPVESAPHVMPPVVPASSKRLVWFVLAGVVILTGGAYAWMQMQSPTLTACTEEAMLCPDGSSVGRVGPTCEFAPCPSVTPDPMAGWKTYTNTSVGYTLRYLDSWNLESETSIETVLGKQLQPPVGYSITISKIEKTLQQVARPYGSYAQQQQIQFAGNDATLLTISSDEGGVSKVIYIPRGSYAVVIWVSQVGYGETDQILSTFKFTDAVSAECLEKPETSGIGGSMYPVAAKYSTLGGLGAYLTAEDCSATRFAEVVKNQYPHYGEHIVLSRVPSLALIAVLRQIGLMPSPEKCANKSESSCTDWRALNESNFIPANLVRLRPFIDFISYTDCYFCG